MTGAVLYSGSKGNSTFISDGETSLIIDAGGSMKKLCEGLSLLGEELGRVRGIFVTHSHTDHTSSLYNIVKKYDIRIFTTVDTARTICTPCKTNSLEDCRRVAGCIMTINPSKTYEVGTIKVSTFPTPHDAVGSLGFVFRSTHTNKVLGYATDIGTVTPEMEECLMGLKNFVIESNHDVEMLKNGSYPEFLKGRILSRHGHLSNADCAEFIKRLALAGGESFTLAHLSEENNLPSLARESAEEALRGFEGVSLKVAGQNEVTKLEIR